jgi:PleD family two-component response regulator
MNLDIKVLIVDDDPDVLSGTSRILRTAGFQVQTASTGAQCLASAKENRPDIILLDVILPDVEGLKLCRQIKEDHFFKGVYVILISGMRTASAEQADGLDVGADGYITRPVSNRELISRINAMVRILTAERERDKLIIELEAALARIKTLSGFLPICSYCKKIRDDRGYWNQIEAYIRDHSEAEFTHGICPDCMNKLHPGLISRIEERRNK